MGTITRLEKLMVTTVIKTPHFLKILVSSSPLSSYSPNGRKIHPRASKSACFPSSTNLALIQDYNLLCPLSNGQAVSDENQGLI